MADEGDGFVSLVSSYLKNYYWFSQSFMDRRKNKREREFLNFSINFLSDLLYVYSNIILIS